MYYQQVPAVVGIRMKERDVSSDKRIIIICSNVWPNQSIKSSNQKRYVGLWHGQVMVDKD